MTANTTLQYVIRDKQAIGFLLSAGPKGWKAYDQDGRPIGLWATESEAARAIYECSTEAVSNEH